jgi:hypothetical protein
MQYGEDLRQVPISAAVMTADSDGKAAVLRLADQAERAILSPVAGDARFREAIRVGHAMQLADERIAAGDNALTASALPADDLLVLAIANPITPFAPPRVVPVGTTFALGQSSMTALRGALEPTLPPWLKDVSEIALDEEADDTAWTRGAAAAALKELYGAPWSTTGPARPRNSTTETGREAE